MNDYCPECEAVAPSHIELRAECYHMWDRTVTLDDVPVRICDGCGADRGDEALDDAALVRAFQLAGLLECPQCGRYGPPEQWTGMNGRCPRCTQAQRQALDRMTALADEDGADD